MDSHYFLVLWNVWPQFPKAGESEFKTLALGEREREIWMLQSSQEQVSVLHFTCTVDFGNIGVKRLHRIDVAILPVGVTLHLV
jgi:hypothetical protein